MNHYSMLTAIDKDSTVILFEKINKFFIDFAKLDIELLPSDKYTDYVKKAENGIYLMNITF